MNTQGTLDAGAFHEVLTVQNSVTTPLPGGSSTTTWQDQATVRARLRPLKGREQLLARQVIGSTPYEVTVRAPLPAGASLRSSSRLVWESPTGRRTLEASEPPRLDPWGRYLTLLCTEREPNA